MHTIKMEENGCLDNDIRYSILDNFYHRVASRNLKGITVVFMNEMVEAVA